MRNSMEFKSESIYCRHKIHENWKRSLSNPIHIPLFPYKSNAHHDDQFSTYTILTQKSNLTLPAHHSGVDVWYGLCQWCTNFFGRRPLIDFLISSEAKQV